MKCRGRIRIREIYHSRRHVGLPSQLSSVAKAASCRVASWYFAKSIYRHFLRVTGRDRSIEWVWCQPAVRVREHGSWFRSAGLARPDFWVFNESMSRRADRALSRVRLFVSGLEPFVKLSWIPLAASVITIYEPAARYFFIGLLRLFSAAGPNLARAPSFFNRIINEFRPARFNYRLYTVEAELLSCKS